MFSIQHVDTIEILFCFRGENIRTILQEQTKYQAVLFFLFKCF